MLSSRNLLDTGDLHKELILSELHKERRMQLDGWAVKPEERMANKAYVVKDAFAEMTRS